MTRHRSIIAAAVSLAVLAAPAGASAADRDHDKMRDSWEKHFKLNTHKNDARGDKDHDGLRNLSEFRAGTNPRKRDTDGDHVRDDREGAGTIKSFDTTTGVLTIDLFDSDQDLTGKVDSTTKIECENEAEHQAGEHARHGSDDNSGPGNATEDNSGPGNATEDNSGPGREGDDRGDDRGDDNGDDRGDDRGDDEATCGPEALVVGRTVKEAELNEGDDGPADVFHEIELNVR
jgi:opacity protein-like surface antigen